MEGAMAVVDRERIAVCSWSLKPADGHDLVRQLNAVGLTKVQLALGPMSDDLPAVLSDAGITVVSGMFGTVGEDYSTLDTIRRTGGVVPDAHWAANQRIAEEAAVAARKVGTRVVSFHAGFIPHGTDPGYRTLVDRLATIAGIYQRRGMDLLLETGQETAEDLLAMLGDLRMSNVGVNFDPANMILYDKGEPITSLRKLLPHVRQVHIKDAVRTTKPGEWGREVPVGEGQVDWRQFKQALKDAGYAGYYVIEREAGPNRVADVRRAVDVLTT
jgi:L-ribulose-5-phosphate 3-epimerase